MEETNWAMVQHLTTAQELPANVQEISRTPSELALVLEVMVVALAEFKISKSVCCL